MEEPRIIVDPKIMFGKPCISGTRIPAQLILQMLATGSSREDILAGYERLTDEDISAALRFAASRLGPTIAEAAE